MKLLLGLTLCCFAITQTKSADLFPIAGSTYYSSYPDQLNWHQALRFCTYNGMYLVDMRSDFENKRVLSIIDQIYTKYKVSALDFWTSGTDLGSESQFYWASTGHQMLYTYWGAGEPTIGSSFENCVHYWGARKDTWNDSNCEFKKYFICRDTFDVPIYKNAECPTHGRKLF